MDALYAFRHPELLLLLVVPLGLLIWSWSRQDGVALPHESSTGEGRGWNVALRVADCVPALLLAVAVLLLAGQCQA
jgi:hypothetical protein